MAAIVFCLLLSMAVVGLMVWDSLARPRRTPPPEEPAQPPNPPPPVDPPKPTWGGLAEQLATCEAFVCVKLTRRGSRRIEVVVMDHSAADAEAKRRMKLLSRFAKFGVNTLRCLGWRDLRG